MKITLWTGEVVVGKEAMVDCLTDGYFEGIPLYVYPVPLKMREKMKGEIPMDAEDVIDHFQKLLSSDKISEEIVATLLEVLNEEVLAMPNK